MPVPPPPQAWTDAVPRGYIPQRAIAKRPAPPPEATPTPPPNQALLFRYWEFHKRSRRMVADQYYRRHRMGLHWGSHGLQYWNEHHECYVYVDPEHPDDEFLWECFQGTWCARFVDLGSHNDGFGPNGRLETIRVLAPDMTER